MNCKTCGTPMRSRKGKTHDECFYCRAGVKRTKPVRTCACGNRIKRGKGGILFDKCGTCRKTLNLQPVEIYVNESVSKRHVPPAH